MFTFDSIVDVALISSIGAVVGAAVTGFFGWLISRKPTSKPDVDILNIVESLKGLNEDNELKDKEIDKLQTKVRRLEKQVRQLLGTEQRSSNG